MNKSNNKPKHKIINLEFDAIGTHWWIEIYDQETLPDGVVESIKATIELFDKNYSRFRSDSLVTKMSLLAGKYSLPKDAKLMMDLYQDLYKITDGKVTPLVGQMLSDAGYDKDYSLSPKTIFDVPKWDEVLGYDYPNLTIKKPALLDFGACGKGYLVDLICEAMHGHGLKRFLVNAGGDMRHSGSVAVEVGLEHPEDEKLFVGVAGLKNLALCGSAGNRRAWGEFTHIMDPSTHKSASRFKAVWVTAETAMLADALTTALYFTDAETLMRKYAFNYAAILQDNTLMYSKDFPAELFVESR